MSENGANIAVDKLEIIGWLSSVVAAPLEYARIAKELARQPVPHAKLQAKVARGV